MERFRHIYDEQRTADNFHLADFNAIKSAVTKVRGSIKEGKIFKGKAGENFRIYVCRLLECFSICEVPLQPDDINAFKVIDFRLRILLRKMLKIHNSQFCLPQ